MQLEFNRDLDRDHQHERHDARDRARNEYTQAIRTKDNTQGAQEEAAKYLKDPYQRAARD